MKKRLFALGLFSVPGIFAHAFECCPQNICELIKCIECECYTPPFYNSGCCSWGLSLTADFLYWYAFETHLPLALKVQLRSNNYFSLNNSVSLMAREEEFFTTNWYPGFRVGLGWNPTCDGWDLYSSWTYFRDKKLSAVSVSPNYFVDGVPPNFGVPNLGQFALLNPWINQSVINSNDNYTLATFNKVQGKWILQLNYIDLELGRKYWLSGCFVLRPYAGVRGTWVRTHFRTNSLRNGVDIRESNGVDVTFIDRFKNKFWGVGLLSGVQPTWYVCKHVALFGNVDLALLWGKFRTVKKEKYQGNSFNSEGIVTPFLIYDDKSKDRFTQMQAIVDLAIGIRFDDSWCDDQYRIALDLSWEHHMWFDQNHRLKTQNTVIFNNLLGFTNFKDVYGDLMMGGFVARLRFDF